jgi:hypothetical protein
MEGDIGTANSGTSGPGIVAEQVQRGAQDMAQQAQQVAGQAVQTAQVQAKSAVQTGAGSIADRLDAVGQALQSASEQLDENGQSQVSGYISTAADRINGFSTYLRNTPPELLIQDTEDMARGRPEIFLAGAFALGFLAARFLKSSPRQTAGSPYGYGSYNDGSYGSPYGAMTTDRYGAYGVQSSMGQYSETPTYTDVAGSTAGGFVAGTGTAAGEYDTVPTSQGRYDVTGMPDVETEYAPGLTGEDAGGTESDYGTTH